MNSPANAIQAKPPGLQDLLEKYPVILQLARFGAIGVLNTALDFLVLNFVSKTFSVSSGASLGGVNVPGFILAVIQSYYWNKYWAFDRNAVSLLKNFIRLLSVGMLGVLSLAFVLLGSKTGAMPGYYLMILFVYAAAELALWFGFRLSANSTQQGNSFWSFITVSIVGLAINSFLLSLVSSHIALAAGADLNKNLAKILATGASLVWNFIGYKIFVFKK